MNCKYMALECTVDSPITSDNHTTLIYAQTKWLNIMYRESDFVSKICFVLIHVGLHYTGSGNLSECLVSI